MLTYKCSFWGRAWENELSRFRSTAEKAFSALALLVLSPLFLLIALAITLTSHGPVIFRQVRVGKDKALFVMFKFRTMHVGAEREHEALVTSQLANGGSFLIHQPDDPRTTGVGKVLRKLSLDELPQLVNVLLGTMSLVGPRPMMPDELAHLSVEQMQRFSVAPGITGLAQIKGRSLLSSEDYVGYDLELIANYSARLYWRILLLTPLSVLSTRGAL